MTQTTVHPKTYAKVAEPTRSTTVNTRPAAGLIPWARRRFPYLKDEMQHWADRFWNMAEDELFSGDLKPRTDIVETESSLIIQMDVPGFEPEQLDIQMSENTITVSSQHETESKGEQDEKVFVHRRERPRGSFSRTFALPREVTGHATAECRHGVLTITLPKSDDSSTTRKIKVTA